MSGDPTTELGSSGIAISGGLVLEEWNDGIRRIGANKLYTEMRDNDPVIGAILFVVEYLLAHQPFHVDKGEGRRAKDAAKFVEDCMHDMDFAWADFIQEALSMLQYGWSYHEIVYKVRDDGRLGWRKIPLRAQNSLFEWGTDGQNNVTGMFQQDNWLFGRESVVFIPIEKAVHFRTTPYKANPEGRSVLRSAVRPYNFLKRLQEIEAIGIERELAGLPVLEVPPEYLERTAPAEKRAMVAQWRKDMGQIRKDERMGLVIPASQVGIQSTGFKFSLLSSAGKHAVNTHEVIQRYEGHIATTMLAQFVLLGMSGNGSFALADKQASVFTIALQHALSRIVDEINRKLVPDLLRLNGFDKRDLPKIRAEKIQDISLSTIATFVNQLVAADVIRSDDGLEDHLRTIADLPPRGEPRPPVENPLGAGRPNAGDPTDRAAADKETAKDKNDTDGGERQNVRTETSRKEPK